jgi:hypothetical protein
MDAFLEHNYCDALRKWQLNVTWSFSQHVGKVLK